MISTLGLGYVNTTKYSDSNERMSFAAPYFYIQYDDFFLDAAEGPGLTADWENGVYFTQALDYSMGRAERNGTHGFNDNWWSYIDISYSHLTRKVNKSGIVYKNGQADLSAGILYSFWLPTQLSAKHHQRTDSS